MDKKKEKRDQRVLWHIKNLSMGRSKKRWVEREGRNREESSRFLLE